MILRIAIVMCFVVTLSACRYGSPALTTTESGNAEVRVDLIAEWDGIRLYRVTDGSARTVYVSDSRGGSRVSWTTTEGKVLRHHETLEVR